MSSANSAHRVQVLSQPPRHPRLVPQVHRARLAERVDITDVKSILKEERRHRRLQLLQRASGHRRVWRLLRVRSVWLWRARKIVRLVGGRGTLQEIVPHGLLPAARLAQVLCEIMCPCCRLPDGAWR